ncbi:MAG: YIP1 family protein [Acidobacteria bacterium]|nr:YIP1 family protein [Acidobacteriota bacterium]
MTQESTPAAQPLSFVQRVIGVVVSPGETMARIVAAPRWLDVLALTTVLSAALFALFLSTEVGKAAYVDQAVASSETWGQTVTEQQYAGIQQFANYAAAIQGVSILVMGPIFTLVVAGVLYGVFTVMGGESKYTTVLSVVSHAGIISLLGLLFTIPINYQRQSMASATNLGVFFPNLAEGSVLASVLGFVDLFWVWYLVVLAIGVAATYRRKWTSVAGGFFVLYVLIGLAVAAIKAVMGGR